MLRSLLFTATLCLFAGALRAAENTPCFAPAGEWITAGELAAVAPGLAGLPADLKVSYAPIAGLVRIFHPDELRRLAQAHGLPDPGLRSNICAAWPVAPLTPEKLIAAMKESLAGSAPQIELISQSKMDAPAGKIVFPLAGITAYSDNAVIWKGYVIYSGTRHFDTWASVKVRVRETHLKARGPIHAGERITPDHWIAEQYSGPPLREKILSDATQANGLVARRDFLDNAPLNAVFFEPPKAVERGDVVTVSSGVGGAQIEAQGEALAAGSLGDVVLIRNPRSNRTFKARIAAAGRVEVLPGTSVGLSTAEPIKGNSL